MIKQKIKTLLVFLQPVSLAMMVVGGGVLWQYGTGNIINAPRSMLQVAGATSVGAGAASYLMEQGYILTN